MEPEFPQNEKLRGYNPKNDLGFFPSSIYNSTILFKYKEEYSKITWQTDGVKLLLKNSFNQEDIRIYRFLILKNCIPKEYIGELWFISSGAKKEMLNNPGYYDYLNNNYPSNYFLPSLHQIDLDMHRTFPEDPFYNNQDNIEKLRNILINYSKRNISIGYVQGFNFIVGKIFKFLQDEEKSFWIFVQIIENILPIDFYSEMAGVMADVDILLCLIKQIYIPDLLENLDDGLMIYFKNIIMQWFLSLFILNFPESSQIIIWNMFFIEKKIVLFKSAIFLMKLVKNNLLEIKDMEKFKNFLKNYFENFNNNEYLKKILILKKFEIDNLFIDVNRKYILENYILNINKINEFKVDLLKKEISEKHEFCDTNCQICVYDYKMKYNIIENFVLKNNDHINIIDNYLDDENLDKKYNVENNYNNEKINYNNILLERGEHYCYHLKRNKTKSEEKCEEEDNYSTGTDQSNNEKEKENFIRNSYYEMKKQYKQLKKSKCKTNFENFKKGNENENYETFITNINNNYNKMSLFDIIVLHPTEAQREKNMTLSQTQLDFSFT